MVAVTISLLLASPTIFKNVVGFSETKGSESSEIKISGNLHPSNVMEVKIVAKKDDRPQILSKFLSSKNSPMAKDAKELVEIADKYTLDYRLLPSIAGVESSFGLAIPSGSFNPYGWNNGKYYFKNWVHASEEVAKGIRVRYIRNGPANPYVIGPSYAANPNWAYRVDRFMTSID